jgi:uncharacterized iron-regulated protein
MKILKLIGPLVGPLIGLVLCGNLALGEPQILNGKTLAPTKIEQALSQVKPGTIVVLGEEHNTQAQPLFQIQVMAAIKKMGLPVSVGMEFLNYPFQPIVDQFIAGIIAEASFLKQILWGSFSFDSYRQQILFPKAEGSTTIALNAPATLTSKVAKLGLSSLSQEEADQLPPRFHLGNDLYFERFQEIIGSHLPNPDALDRYFAAQSIWDDTMSWKATDFIKSHPNQVLVIIVGEFHVQYGGGLPDRIKARGINDVLTFSLINTQGMNAPEIEQYLGPSKRYGERANFIWTDQYDRSVRPMNTIN